MLEDAAAGEVARAAGGSGRRRSCGRRLLDQRAAGQPQEDVLERRPADEDGLGPEAALVDGDRRRLAVVGVEEHAVRQVLDPLGDAVELAVERLGDARREAQLGDLAGRVLLDEARAGCPRRRSSPCP